MTREEIFNDLSIESVSRKSFQSVDEFFLPFSPTRRLTIECLKIETHICVCYTEASNQSPLLFRYCSNCFLSYLTCQFIFLDVCSLLPSLPSFCQCPPASQDSFIFVVQFAIRLGRLTNYCKGNSELFTPFVETLN